MYTEAVIRAVRSNQTALYILTILELTGYLYPPPALLRPGDTFDYIIVGGGTSGSVIATRLAQQEYNVLLIEAGQDATFESTYPSLVTYLKYSQVDWNITSENDKYSYRGQVNQNVDLCQGKMLGGTSALNYMIYSRGNPQDFQDWYRITGDPAWKWKNVLPYFKRAESIHDNAIMTSSLKHSFGSKGYIGVTRENKCITEDFLKGFKQIGKKLINDIDGNKVGYSRGLITAYDGVRQDAGSQYFKHVTDNPYLAVAKGTLATKIIFDENKNAIGVEVVTEENEKIVVHARQEIILSAGAFRSPQLLMLSGLGPKKDLENLNISCLFDMPVGKNLQDHIAVFIPHTTNRTLVDTQLPPSEYPTGLFVGYASLKKSNPKRCRKVYSKHCPLCLKKYSKRCTIRPLLPDHEAMGFIMNDMEFLLQFCALTFNFPFKICDKLFDEANPNQVLITLLGNLHARSRGQVLLRSADPKDPPKILTDSFSYDPDLDNFVKYIQNYLEVEESEAFKRLEATMVDLTTPKCDEFEKRSREYWRCYTLNMMVSLGTYGGTCAMGTVVDSRLRVRNVNRLRVADASIMPTIVAGNTANAVIMIGEKAADMIIEDAGAYNLVEHETISKDQIKNLP